jgi:hypothetical protein
MILSLLINKYISLSNLNSDDVVTSRENLKIFTYAFCKKRDVTKITKIKRPFRGSHSDVLVSNRKKYDQCIK